MPDESEVIALWIAFKKGDRAAYARLINIFYKVLFNYGTKLCQDILIVEDCIQDLFLELWQRRDYLSDTEYVKFYLLKALRRKIYFEKNIQQKRQQIAIDTDYEVEFIGEFSIEANIIEIETTDQQLRKLNHILTKLTKREREVIYLKFYQEMDYEQIANLMSINYQSARNLIHTAIKAMKNAWQKD
ncbi:MAG: sigma-70 family RNA polymerase sigma factor [Spirosomataceae bacterium]